MSEYEQYVQNVNTIFEIIESLKSWKDQDNLSLIEGIEMHKQTVINCATKFSKEKKTEQSPGKVEALGND